MTGKANVVESYKGFALEVGERVAAAHKVEGEAVSGYEREAIAKITAAPTSPA
jgi:hypothetical protein